MNRQRDAVGLTAFDDAIVDDAAGERAARATCGRCCVTLDRLQLGTRDQRRRSRCTSSPTR